jgi:hypothetical protein
MIRHRKAAHNSKEVLSCRPEHSARDLKQAPPERVKLTSAHLSGKIISLDVAHQNVSQDRDLRDDIWTAPQKLESFS